MHDDDTWSWVIPALTLGYSVADDPCGKLRFWTDTVHIVWRDGWMAFDAIDEPRRYDSLMAALKYEYDENEPD